MSTIAFPLNINQRRAAVAGLHAALEELVARDAFLTRDWAARAQLVRALAADRKRSRFGAATRRPPPYVTGGEYWCDDQA